MHDVAFVTLLLAHGVLWYASYRAVKMKWHYEKMIDEIRTELWRHNIAYDDKETP